MIHLMILLFSTSSVGVVKTRDEVQLILDHGMELESSTEVVAI